MLVPTVLLGLVSCTAPLDPRDVLAPPINAINALFAMLPPPPPPLTALPPTPRPGRLTLSNFAYDRARVEAMITPYPDCELREGMSTSNFEVPLNGTRVIDSPPGADVCWRRLEPPLAENPLPGAPRVTPWNRACVSGRNVDSRL
jgi:hypothetical protein